MSILLKFVCCLALAVPVFAQNPIQPGQLPGRYVPLSTTDKFKYRFFDTALLRGLAGAALGAGFEQVRNTPHEWGQGVDGYAKRYASAFGGAIIRQTLNFGFESVLHEDPRYFPLDGNSKKARAWNALKQTFLARSDNGTTTFAYGRVAAAFATGQITRTWLPPSDRTTADGFGFGGISLGIDLGVNVLYEFFPSSRPKEINKP